MCHCGLTSGFPWYLESDNDLTSSKIGTIKFMTFNAWFSGDNVKDGLHKIIRHLLFIQPDVVAFQEMSEAKLDLILSKLNDSTWYKCNQTSVNRDNDPFIISKFPIVQHYKPGAGFRNVACQLQVSSATPELFVNVWNWHLPPYPYGPYIVCLEGKVESDKDLMKYEYDATDHMAKNRLNTVYRLLNHTSFINLLNQTDYSPMILAGDFNSPSHRDWTLKTRLTHCNRTFEWPVTKFLENLGFADSFRTMYPDPSEDPGYTWSPIYTYNTEHIDKLEPKDRIDMIFYKGSKLKLVSSKVYKGETVVLQHPKHKLNDWPSDHAAVISEFEIYEYY